MKNYWFEDTRRQPTKMVMIPACRSELEARERFMFTQGWWTEAEPVKVEDYK